MYVPSNVTQPVLSKKTNEVNEEKKKKRIEEGPVFIYHEPHRTETGLHLETRCLSQPLLGLLADRPDLLHFLHVL